MIRKLLTILNKLLPKYKRVIVEGFPNIEPSAIEIYKELQNRRFKELYYVIDTRQKDFPYKILLEGNFLRKNSISYFFKYLTSDTIIFTHGSFLNSFSKRQKVINIWHGLCFKPVGRLIGGKEIKADITISTSEFTKFMFVKSFGVSYESVKSIGYPRNDILLRECQSKDKWREILSSKKFDNYVLWSPTYRQSIKGDIRSDGAMLDPPFYVNNFDIGKFNNLLRNTNSLCIVKQHPMAAEIKNENKHSNILIIDDYYLSNKGMTLYHLMAICDLLISDISSVMADFLLLNKPILCIAEDLEDYRKTRGFYFDDIENWIPGELHITLESFMLSLSKILDSGEFSPTEKQLRIKEIFFNQSAGSSAKKLADLIETKGSLEHSLEF